MYKQTHCSAKVYRNDGAALGFEWCDDLTEACIILQPILIRDSIQTGVSHWARF